MKKAKNAMPLRAKIACALDYPPDCLGGLSEVTVCESGDITVTRCRRVLVYKKEKIRLQLCRSVLCLCGENLLLHTYFDGHMTVSGQIYTMEFEEGQSEC